MALKARPRVASRAARGTSQMAVARGWFKRCALEDAAVLPAAGRARSPESRAALPQAASGNLTVTTRPEWSAGLSRLIEAWCASAIRRTIDSPSPLPAAAASLLR